MRLPLRALLTSVVTAFVATLVNGQWSFTVDLSFQTQISQKNVNSLLLNDDVTVIASGIMRFPGDSGNRRLVRLLTNGMLDPVFEQPGYGAGRLTRWMDRYYVGAGQTFRRILANGGLDPTFMEPAYSPYFSALQGGDYHVYPDGRVLISGNHQLNDSIRGFVGRHQLIWFTNTGYLDTTRTHRNGGNCAVYKFKELPNGQFICSGNCNQWEGQEVDWIFRVNADGSPDTTFRSGVFIGDAKDYLGLTDGRIYAGGNFQRSDAPDDTLRLARFLPDGLLDPTFSVPQFTAGEGLSTPYGAYVHGITAWRNGTLIITGQFKRVNGQIRKGVCLIDSTGQLLPGFDGQGVGPYTYQGLTNAAILRSIFNSDSSQLYICGAYNGYDDGIANYPEQRFITRLNVLEVPTGLPSQVEKPTAMLQLFPNPATMQVVFNYKLPGNTSTAQLRLRDASGRVVTTLQIAGEQGQPVMDTCSMAPGVYTVELLRNGRVERTERLVIQP